MNIIQTISSEDFDNLELMINEIFNNARTKK